MASRTYVMLTALDQYETPKTVLVDKEEYGTAPVPARHFNAGTIREDTARVEGDVDIKGPSLAVGQLPITLIGDE